MVSLTALGWTPHYTLVRDSGACPAPSALPGRTYPRGRLVHHRLHGKGQLTPGMGPRLEVSACAHDIVRYGLEWCRPLGPAVMQPGMQARGDAASDLPSLRRPRSGAAGPSAEHTHAHTEACKQQRRVSCRLRRQHMPSVTADDMMTRTSTLLDPPSAQYPSQPARPLTTTKQALWHGSDHSPG